VGRFTRGRMKENGAETAREPWVLSRDAYRRVVENRVRERFGMSLTEFAEAFRAGKLADDPSASELAVVSGASPR
jgi:hypothetical protein